MFRRCRRRRARTSPAFATRRGRVQALRGPSAKQGGNVPFPSRVTPAACVPVSVYVLMCLCGAVPVCEYTFLRVCVRLHLDFVLCFLYTLVATYREHLSPWMGQSEARRVHVCVCACVLLGWQTTLEAGI